MSWEKIERTKRDGSHKVWTFADLPFHYLNVEYDHIMHPHKWVMSFRPWIETTELECETLEEAQEIAEEKAINALRSVAMKIKRQEVPT